MSILSPRGQDPDTILTTVSGLVPGVSRVRIATRTRRGPLVGLVTAVHLEAADDRIDHVVVLPDRGGPARILKLVEVATIHETAYR